ncbi:hypothetical protein [Halocynthiibacter styelae]|uniref:Uncharacterized protein n=1 Tax=Halocynthiibacter styelae TaxID=2761955 RepID=A0A8J7J4P5_9RHOB|nr:hypothetical protein [Paenihalocynthiibacter styelae]MBI1493260.1 hypothetical protein [Paenihalocynthiibacter styelae]
MFQDDFRVSSFYSRASDMADKEAEALSRYSKPLITIDDMRKLIADTSGYGAGVLNGFLQDNIRAIQDEFGDAGLEALCVLCRFRSFMKHATAGVHPKDDSVSSLKSEQMQAAVKMLNQLVNACRSADLANNPDSVAKAVDLLGGRVDLCPDYRDGTYCYDENTPVSEIFFKQRDFYNPLNEDLRAFVQEFGEGGQEALLWLRDNETFLKKVGVQLFNRYGLDGRDTVIDAARWVLAELTVLSRKYELNSYPGLAWDVVASLQFRTSAFSYWVTGEEVSAELSRFAKCYGLSNALELQYRIYRARPWIAPEQDWIDNGYNGDHNGDVPRVSSSELSVAVGVATSTWLAAGHLKDPLLQFEQVETSIRQALYTDVQPMRAEAGIARRAGNHFSGSDVIIFGMMFALCAWFLYLFFGLFS